MRSPASIADLIYGPGRIEVTRAAPALEDPRDAMLASAALHAADEICLIWNGFAELGIGVGADGRNEGSFNIVESFAVPANASSDRPSPPRP